MTHTLSAHAGDGWAEITVFGRVGRADMERLSARLGALIRPGGTLRVGLNVPDHDPILLPPYDIYPFDPARGSQSGAMSASTIASAENGKKFFDDITAKLCVALVKEFDLRCEHHA